MPDQSRRGEQGFTLIELLIAIMVSGLILSALTTAFITTIRGEKDLHDRFVQSHDAQLLAAYFPSDVQSADPNLGVSTSTSAWAASCPAASNPGATVPNVLQMQWSETISATTTQFAVSYRTRQVPVVPNENVRYELVRYFCSGGTVKSEVVAHNITSPIVAGTLPNVTLTLTSVAAPTTSTAGNYSFTFSGRMRTPVPPPPHPVASSITRKLTTPTNASTVTWRVLFDRAVTGVNSSDFTTVVTGLTGVGTPTVTPVSSSEYTVSVTTGTGSGAIGLNLVDDNSIKDAASPFNPLGGPALGDGNYTGQSYDIDRTSPTVSSIALTNGSPTSGPTLSWTVTFSEDVSGVDTADFNPVRTGLVTGGTLTVTPVSSLVYTVALGPVSGSGTVGLNLVDNNSIVDDAANPLGGPTAGDGNFTGAVYTVTTLAPAAPSITAVQLVNKTGGTAGKIETGDQVVITFSAMIKVSSFCSGWSGDGSNQSLTAGNDVTVTVTDSGANDKLTVASASCTFHFGTLQLNGDYVSATVNYAGSGSGSNTPSAIAWDATNHRLTITMGKDSPNNKANAGISSLPKYTVDASVTDPYNQAVTPSSFTATTIQQF